MRSLRHIGLFVGGALLLAAVPALAQTAPTRDDIVAKLDKYQADLELDVPALRQQVTERSKMRGKTEPPPGKRPPIAPDLKKLPTFNVDISFDVDTPIVQPESYQTVGRIADALVHSSLLPYTILVVGHIEANGKREAKAGERHKCAGGKRGEGRLQDHLTLIFISAACSGHRALNSD